ncbi:DUF1097 domain-containing protein [Burkholderia gladioli]|uniref:DUF1097 domain-containing protein n=1 Tax=Burkholderia gladioli TaxID=28095 RepID=UPI0016403D50|nr:DUF1097 domain-containing protein [Burkholderia gladioli]
MKKLEALTVSIGLLAFIDTWLTATVFPVPVWVTFIAWASFFVVGGGTRGYLQSLASNLVGAVIAALSLLAIAGGDGSPLFAAFAVGLGSAAMVQASRLALLNVLPAVVWGYASTVGTSIATAHPITTAGWHNPLLVAAAALVTGASFGFGSERFAGLLSRKPQPAY